ncbi:TPA: hypothetical protein KV183_003664 [Morganella morganii]|uniref:Uncharacterized protein n=1 Tax=Morganella morganii TaxID=582 RepID=A0AAN5MG25_MORMO|nr:hypothetical protein [Morganella morganii]HAT3809509.1 hypothetical protein [Morganella morganii]HBH7054165.1 hypothetical protein [Morganella morganii]HEI9844538.1 hypothetical protein [Morganella morganii]
MKELNFAEMEQVSGAGCVQDTITDLGKKLGDWGFELLGPYLTVDLPVIGKVSLKDAYPGLGRDIGGKVGSVVGSFIEDKLGGTVDLGGICK